MVITYSKGKDQPGTVVTNVLSPQLYFYVYNFIILG